MFHITAAELKKLFRKAKGIIVNILIVGLTLVPFMLAVPGYAADVGRYEVVAGGNDNAYLVDTTTGFVWILSYRALPTGREPVAIPYKFLGLSPQNQGTFLLENKPVFLEPEKESK
jgi:hypothetical protein